MELRTCAHKVRKKVRKVSKVREAAKCAQVRQVGQMRHGQGRLSERCKVWWALSVARARTIQALAIACVGECHARRRALPCQNSPFNTRPELADWALECHASSARPHAQSAGAQDSAGPRTYSPRRQELSGCTFAAPGHTRVYGSDGGAGGPVTLKKTARDWRRHECI